MIKKLHQLKAKKGFTLVELLVVIAIIGILAAILIPLMSNFMRSARVSSANSTAASAQSNLTYLLQQERVKNRGVVLGTAGSISIAFGPTRGQTAALPTITALNFEALPGAGTAGAIYTSEVTPSFGTPATHISTIAELIRYSFETEFPEVTNSVFHANVNANGHVDIVLFAPGAPAAVIAAPNLAAFITPATATADAFITPTVLSNGLVLAPTAGLARNSVVGSDPQS